MSQAQQREINNLSERVDALEKLIGALKQDLTDPIGPDPIDIPNFPRALRELGFTPPGIETVED
jgi:cell division protein FtsB